MQYKTVQLNQPFTLESGYTFPELTLAYNSIGILNAKKNNVIWVCHAFSANSNVDEWWPGAVGTDKVLDPKTHFIICVNIPGSCYGSTGPLSINPLTQTPYFHSFPIFTIRDVVNSFILLADKLGISKIETLVGGSLGGQQALEWAIMQPNRIENLILSATNAEHSPWGIAFNESQRMAIRADQTWKESNVEAGKNGMKAARSIGLLSYRNYQTYQKTQTDHVIEILPNKRKAVSYQNYQGEKLGFRFNAFSYTLLSQTMDTHHVGRGRNGIEDALKLISANTLVIGIGSDYLFPVEEQKLLARLIPCATYEEIDSTFGHDGFLVEVKKISSVIYSFFEKSEARIFK